MQSRFLIFRGLFLAAFPLALAWASLGHMLITQIASEQLMPAAQAAIDESMGPFNAAKNGEFTSDDTPSCGLNDSRQIRFRQVALHQSAFQCRRRPAPDGEHEPNVFWGVQCCTDIISGKAEDPTVDKGQVLVMLLHLAGDTHQPMHTTNCNNDAGGNRVELKGVELTKAEEFFSRYKKVNLHAFWDSSYRRTFRDGLQRDHWGNDRYRNARHGWRYFKTPARKQHCRCEQRPQSLFRRGNHDRCALTAQCFHFGKAGAEVWIARVRPGPGSKADFLSGAGQGDGAGQSQGYQVEHHHAVDDEERFHRARGRRGTGWFELQ